VEDIVSVVQSPLTNFTHIYPKSRDLKAKNQSLDSIFISPSV